MLGLAYQWFIPGVTWVPAEDGHNRVQVEDARQYPMLTDQNALELCFPTSTDRQRKVLVPRAHQVMKHLADAGEFRIIEGRILPPHWY